MIKTDFNLSLTELTEASRADNSLTEILRAANVNPENYYLCSTGYLFREGELPEVMDCDAAFGNTLVMGGDALKGYPSEGVYSFKRNPTFKYVRYMVGQGQMRDFVECLLFPKTAKDRAAFIDYLIKEIADLEHQSRHSSHKERAYNERLFLPKETSDSLFGNIKLWMESRAFYVEHKIPWKLGILLYGPPGNGKTLFIKAISEYFDLEVNNLGDYVQFGKLYIPEMETSGKGGWAFNRYDCYKSVYKKDVRPRIYYLEDIDKQIPTGENDIPSLSVNELLQTLDGVKEINNVIVIATTNYVESLIKAIVARPGRFDIVQEIGLPEVDQIKALMDYYKFTTDNDTELVRSLKGNSMAFVENFIRACIMTYKKTEFKYAEVESILQRMKDHAKMEGRINKMYVARGKEL